VRAPTAEATEIYLNTHADIRMEQYLRAPPIILTSVDVTDSDPSRESDYDTEALDPSAVKALVVKTTHERCGPFSLVVLSQRRGRVTTSGYPAKTLSETLSSKLQLNTFKSPKD